MRICSKDGCNRKHTAQGLCNTHYQQMKKQGENKYNETRLERVYGGMKADERERIQAQPCTLCGYRKARRRWGTGCPHHHDEITKQCSQCYLFNSCSACHRTAQDYAELEDGHIPQARNPERIEAMIWLYSDVMEFPQHILDHYDV